MLFAIGSLLIITLGGLPAPMLPIAFFNAFLGAIYATLGVEMIRVPPELEFRPRWYMGKGNPDWLPPPVTRKRPQMSMASGAVFVTMLCCALSLINMSYAKRARDDANDADSRNRIAELGGVIQQGRVSLAGSEVTDDDIETLLDLKRPREINLGATAITDAGVRRLSELRSLHSLTLSGTNVTDNGIGEIEKMRSLMNLELRQTNVTGETIPVRALRSLSTIDLSRCPVTRAGLENLTNVRLLSNLRLSETDIDDSMVDVLASIPTRSLELRETKLTVEGIERLKSKTNALLLVDVVRTPGLPDEQSDGRK